MERKLRKWIASGRRVDEDTFQVFEPKALLLVERQRSLPATYQTAAPRRMTHFVQHNS